MSEPLQEIYRKALLEPGIGFAAHHLFSRSVHVCPKCGAECWLRVRKVTRAPLGITCSKCSWISTYIQVRQLSARDLQLEIAEDPR